MGPSGGAPPGFAVDAREVVEVGFETAAGRAENRRAEFATNPQCLGKLVSRT